MVADAGIARRRAKRAAERRHRAWIALPAGAALILGAAGAAFLIPGLTPATAAGKASAIATAVLAAVAAIAALAARRVRRAPGRRLAILREAVEAAPDAHAIVAPDGGIVYANAAFHRLFPPSGEPPLGRIAQALADPEAAADFARLRNRAAAGGRANAALPLRCGPEAAGWFNVAVSPVGGRPGYSFWNLQDITAQHETEASLRDERDKLADFVAGAPIGLYSADGSGRFLFVNQALAELLGSTPTELLGSGARLHDFLAAAPAPGTAAWDPFGGGAEGIRRGEILLKSRQGATVQAWLGQSVVGAGDSLRTHCVVRDLTPERESEGAQLLSRERFRRLVANAPVGIALLDHNGRLAEANRALGELFGALPQDLIGRPVIDFFYEEDRSDIALRLATAFNAPLPPDPVEVRLKVPRDKASVLFLSRLDGIAGSDGALMLHFIDITEQKSLEIQFAQSQKMQAVGQLAGGVAHDFNNLLTAMIGFCDLLLMQFRPGNPSFADVMQIKQNANRAANLVRQLLAFSRQQALQPRILDITDVLVELSHLLRRLIGENIDLKVVHGRDLGFVKVDQGQLEQVIINLAVNARDAMTGGGTLTIRTANAIQPSAVRRGHEIMPAGNYVLIEVTDTGIGIPTQNLTRVFEPFFSTKEVGSGTGLGLSTVYGIVKQTGGFIFVDSASGRGAVFEIYLPCHPSSDETLTARVEAPEGLPVKDLTGIGTLILVEDEDPVRIFGARALRNKGYKVFEAKSGEAALELMRAAGEKIDLLVTDVVMPKMDGPGLVREVRALHPEMKVIFISGYTEDSFRQRLDSDSEIHFLPKPFSLKQLASKVKDVISGEA